MNLDEKLQAYAYSDFYPFHMPGHKRHSLREMNPYQWDITEIDGFDNLHHATDIIEKLQQDWAALYGCDRAYILVNGTTCGNEAAIFAATKPQDTVIVGRGCHKSVYHAMALRRLQPVYLMPTIGADGIPHPHTLAQVEAAIEAHPEATAVILTSPTYEGLCADIAAIAKRVHAADMTLVVDAAHGAHFGLQEDFPQNPIHEGADAVVVSLHKTLPTFTQTACLLWHQKSRIHPERIQKYLGYFESSSPSYLLMASTAIAVDYLRREGHGQMTVFANRLKLFRQRMQELKQLTVELAEQGADPSKIVIRGRNRNYQGERLMNYLRENAHLELEMATPTYALAMTSIMDSEEGFCRLEQGLMALDQEVGTMEATLTLGDVEEMYLRERNVRKPLWEAVEAESIACPLQQAVGKIAGGFINLYPPGIPVYAPGEQLTAEGVRTIVQAQKAGYQVDGVTEEGSIEILTEE